MYAQLRRHLPPAEAQPVNAHLAIYQEGGREVYYANGTPFFVRDTSDAAARRLVLGQVTTLGLAKPTELSRAVGVDTSTIHRIRNKLADGGVEAVVGGKPGPKGPHKLTPELCEVAQQLLDEGKGVRAVARRLGVSHGTIHHALKQGRLRRGRARGEAADSAHGPEERGRTTPLGVAAQRYLDRGLAAAGILVAAPPEFVASRAVRFGGALLGLPSLLELGLLEVGERVYGHLSDGFYGLRSILLVLAFMALVRIKSPEQLQHAPPGELGVLVGLDRVPEPKTLRRKIRELVGRGLAYVFSDQLARRWVEQNQEVLGFLYVDGHVRPYHGPAHELPKTWVPQRRLCLPAETDFWINDQRGDPILSITAEANDDLTQMLKGEIVPKIRSLLGKRPVTAVFDREGWSPKLFWELAKQGVDVLTYRKGAMEPWPEECFEKVQGIVDGETVEYALAERVVQVMKRPRFSMREIRRLRDDGHQTAILTTRQDLDAPQLAERMFRRWKQENFFRYMAHEFGFDRLLTYRVEAADGKRMVPNPELSQLKKELKKVQERLGRLLVREEDYRRRLETEPKTPKGYYAKRMLPRVEVEIPQLRDRRQVLEAQMADLPERVPVRQAVSKGKVVRLSRQAKQLSNTVKMLVYRAETTLVQLVGPHYARTEDEGRALVRQMLTASANVLPDEEAGLLRVEIHPLATPRANRALEALCGQLNDCRVIYPGTELQMHYGLARDA